MAGHNICAEVQRLNNVNYVHFGTTLFLYIRQWRIETTCIYK